MVRRDEGPEDQGGVGELGGRGEMNEWLASQRHKRLGDMGNQDWPAARVRATLAASGLRGKRQERRVAWVGPLYEEPRVEEQVPLCCWPSLIPRPEAHRSIWRLELNATTSTSRTWQWFAGESLSHGASRTAVRTPNVPLQSPHSVRPLWEIWLASPEARMGVQMCGASSSVPAIGRILGH